MFNVRSARRRGAYEGFSENRAAEEAEVLWEIKHAMARHRDKVRLLAGRLHSFTAIEELGDYLAIMDDLEKDHIDPMVEAAEDRARGLEWV